MNKIKGLALLWLLLYHIPAMAADSLRVEQLVDRAQALQLSARPGWLQLLHFSDHVFGGVYSQADDARFFLAEAGRYDAAAELAASLRGFFAVPVGPADDHAQCRFPARLHWLDAQLSFRQQLPEVHCRQLSDWKQRLDAHSVTLVFPSMYLNNPASMFGHTFLRLDHQERPALLSYALSYAAEHDAGDNALLYVFRGLSGGYAGRFSVQPYYETVQAYGDIEHRDIWEYPLQLDAPQVVQLLRHLWELRDIRFDYYFLRENCSYRLLSLLDVAVGDAPLHNHHPLYAIPVDTVRNIDKAPGISGAVYRPALSSRLQLMYGQLSALQQQQVMHGLRQLQPMPELAQHPAPDAARMLDFMIEYSAYDRRVPTGFTDELLLQRSAISVPQPVFEFAGEDPRDSHASARWQLGMGDQESIGFISLGLRPAFHDALDSPRGFVRGAAISIMDTQLRLYDDDRLRIHAIDFFSIESLNKVTPWNTPLSAAFSFSMQRDDQTNDNIYALSSALGYTLGSSSGLLYALAQLRLDNYQTVESSAGLYAGARLGALWWINPRSRLQLQALLSDRVNHAGHPLRRYQLQYQYDVNHRNALRIRGLSRQRQHVRVDSIELSFMRYF